MKLSKTTIIFIVLGILILVTLIILFTRPRFPVLNSTNEDFSGRVSHESVLQLERQAWDDYQQKLEEDEIPFPNLNATGEDFSDRISPEEVTRLERQAWDDYQQKLEEDEIPFPVLNKSAL